ncbi:hypothetical protein G9C98_008123, partial [Cotesia typhae]
FFFITDTYGRCPNKISGGTRTSIQEHPSIASIRFFGQHICGGVLITTRHILTAGHCLSDDDQFGQGIVRYPKFGITVASGTNNCYHPANVHKIKSFTIHPQYQGSLTNYVNDIAIIELEYVIKPDETQKIAKLPRENTPPNVNAAVVGWGTSDEKEERLSEFLKKANVVTIDNLECQYKLRNFIHAGQLCAVQPWGVGFCYLAYEITIDETQKVVGLPSSDVNVGIYGTSLGWGYTSHGSGVISDVLKMTPMMTLNNHECNQRIPTKIYEGIDGKRPKKIVGGTFAKINDFPFIVSIQNWGNHFCGGALVSKKHVLTAAHCLSTQDQRTKTMRIFDKNAFRIAAGSSSSKHLNRVYEVEKIDVHPAYTGESPLVMHDLGIMTVSIGEFDDYLGDLIMNSDD